jgi:hypothetical protein
MFQDTKAAAEHTATCQKLNDATEALIAQIRRTTNTNSRGEKKNLERANQNENDKNGSDKEIDDNKDNGCASRTRLYSVTKSKTAPSMRRFGFFAWTGEEGANQPAN